MIEDVTNVLSARSTDDGARPTVLFIGDIGQEFIQLCSEEVRCPELQGLTKVLHVHPFYWQCVSFSIVSLTLRCGQKTSSYSQVCAMCHCDQTCPRLANLRPALSPPQNPSSIIWFFNRHRTPRCPLIVPSTPFVRRTTDPFLPPAQFDRETKTKTDHNHPNSIIPHK